LRESEAIKLSTRAFDGHDLDAEVALPTNHLRHFDPTPRRWLDESPVGYTGGDANVTRYVPD
jgi:RHS repeat-associated protein